MNHPIEVEGLGKSFGDVPVLKGIDLSVQAGTMYALLGPNGAGKTTTVRILATLTRMGTGTARVNGYDVVRQAREVRASVGLTGQYAAVDKMLTGRENLVMMGRLYRLGRAAARRRADELIEQFDLVDAAGRQAKTYSGGMRRRLDLAASLIGRPPVIFLDEPTTGLDPRSRATMWAAIRALLGQGTTILLTTQYLEEADQLADRVGVLSDGHIVAEGTPGELKQRVGSERLELTFDDENALGAALAAMSGEKVQREEDGHRVSAPIEGARHLKSILDRVEQAGVEVRHISITEPTLDDVFLTLTDRSGPSRAPGGTVPHQSPAAGESHRSPQAGDSDRSAGSDALSGRSDQSAASAGTRETRSR
ncbi:ATP-binding cassette domain-containing protein [Streptomyces sp. M2CJ-2]|uniref:ATP-binding cassette domain-containing protein n=1 Tax=Streptomyces sp. M2CJ-2 TaxID=2803948 RepID=UPI001929754D|nr:ATP-binding cassette domain-containing protein [Streptomyces sp. M2CJ-2]MBL3670676.1 ATP-binding cassette domain-containing protein [Streptomyces sp. M2CJ-2]